MEEKTNRAYKDTVFVDLFSEDQTAKENFISLYNALFDENLTDTSVLENIRLDQVLYMGLRNDVSFLVKDKIIILAEHQSTINENMPLRFLQYVARLYEKIKDPTSRYARNLVKIPTPEFFVFYNGKEDYPIEKTLKLSDAFAAEKEEIHLELLVKVININKDKNNSMLKRCKKLDEYSSFIQIVRKHKTTGEENSFKNAIKECIEKGILKDYLTRKSKEVNNMLLAEYDYATDIAVQRQEAMLAGEARGISIGEARGISIGEARGKLETAKNFKLFGIDVKKIAEATGLPIEQIESL